MTDKFRIFRRASGLWYLENKETRHQESLRTRDEMEARRLVQATNEAQRQPAINIQIARAYLTASDGNAPFMTTTSTAFGNCL